MNAQAGMLFGNNSTSAATSLSKSDIQTRAAQSIGEFNVNRDQQSANIETNRAADTQHWVGGKERSPDRNGWAGPLARRSPIKTANRRSPDA